MANRKLLQQQLSHSFFYSIFNFFKFKSLLVIEQETPPWWSPSRTVLLLSLYHTALRAYLFCFTGVHTCLHVSCFFFFCISYCKCYLWKVKFTVLEKYKVPDMSIFSHLSPLTHHHPHSTQFFLYKYRNWTNPTNYFYELHQNVSSQKQCCSKLWEDSFVSYSFDKIVLIFHCNIQTCLYSTGCCSKSPLVHIFFH